MKLTKVAVPVLLIFILIGGSALTHFVANKARYIPNDELYVQYSDEDIKSMQLLYRIDALNDHTLEEVFGHGNLLDSEQLVTNGDFSDGITGWSSVSSNISVTNGILKAISTAVGTYGISRNITATLTDKIYSFMLVKNSISGNLTHYIGESGFINYTVVANQYQVISFVGSSSITTFRVYSSTNTIGDYIEIDKTGYFNISTLIANKQYSPLFGTTFDLMSDAQIKAQMDLRVQNEWQWIDFESLNWFPSQERLEKYYQMYLDILDGKRMINQALGTVDMNGRDYYHLDAKDYSNIGINVQQGYQSVLNPEGETMETLGLLSTVANFILSTIGNILDFIQESIDTYEGGFWGGILESFNDLQIPWLGGT